MSNSAEAETERKQQLSLKRGSPLFEKTPIEASAIGKRTNLAVITTTEKDGCGRLRMWWA
ncbi:hypothetical protein OUZ56_002601 [Daphnia magna]|uniref:Uncharacterized protein n=1 Tax=Daphnia magna TaxID=35525 RepID=A0ABR0A676_9CRUS|nr:hypothetical protein OUZ56_002601 [Daphnia magna]